MKHDKNYTAAHLYRQVGLRMLVHPERFFPIIEDYLSKSKESYVSYARNVFYGRRYMTDIVPIVVGEMFNVPISYIVPFGRIVNVCHQEASAKIVLVFNGTGSEDQFEATHVTATKSQRFVHTLFGRNVEMTLPYVLKETEVAKSKAEAMQISRVKKNTIARWHVAQKHITKVEGEIQIAVKALEDAKKHREAFESELKQLGVNIDKLHQDHAFLLNQEKKREQEERVERERVLEEKRKREDLEKMDIHYEEEEEEGEPSETIFPVEQEEDEKRKQEEEEKRK